MATTIETKRSQQYVDFDEYIDYQLERTRGNIKTTDILTALAFVAVFVLAYLFLFVIGDHWLVAEGFSQTTRIVLLSLVSLLSAGWVAWKVLWPYLRQVNRLFAAKTLERSQPELHSTLLNLIDARSAGKELSPAILSAMEKRAALSISQTNVDEAVDRRPLMWACYAVLGLVVAFSLYTLFTPKKVSASVWRALFPVSAVAAPTRTVIENVSPGDVEVIPGTRLEVLADISGQVPKKVILHYSTSDREFVDEPIEMREVPDMPKRFRAQIIGANGEGIQQSLNYHVTAGDARSAPYAVTVLQPPSAEIVELHYSYPKYMDREAKTRPTGNIDDYEGVVVTFLAEGNMPLKSATLTFHDDHGTNFRAESVPMSAIDSERTRFRASWVLSIREEDGIYPRYYTIECKNERGESDPNPTRWPIRIHPDQRPEVKILNPRESQLERPANAVLPLTASARDDFKVKSLTLWKQLNGEPPQKHGTLFEGEESSLSVDYDWRLNADWPLKTGDRISYWVEAQDNRTPTAGKRNSDKYTILIQPEQPEEAVEQQLQSDRRPQEPEPDEADPSEKNPDQTPKPQRPQDDGMKDEGQDSEAQPMPQEGQPQDNQTGEEGEGGDPSDSESQAGEGDPSRSKKNGEGGQSVKNDGTQDDKALESLHKHFNKNQPEPGQDDQQSDQTPDKTDPSNNDPQRPEETPTPGENDEKPMGDQPQPQEGDKTEDPSQQPGDADEEKAGEDSTAKKPEAGETGTEKDQDKSPMPNGAESQPDPASEKSEKPDPSETKTPDTKPGGDKPTDQDTTKPEGGKPEGDQPEGGTDQTTGQGQPSESKDPADSKTETGTGGEETEPSEKGAGQDTKKPEAGREQPADPDKTAEKQPATGEEKGPATSEEDPDADAKPAKNNLDRKDPEKPATTREREGDPENGSPKDQPEPSSEDKTPDRTKPGSENPNDVDPKDGTKPDTNPEERTGQAPEPAPDRKPSQAEDQPNVGDDDLKGEGRPEGQQAEKPDGGEAGGSKQNEQGTPGGEEKGPGDRTPRPGQTDPAPKPNEGQPSQEQGEGSRTRPTDRTEDGGPSESTDPQEDPTSDKPGEGATPSPSERTPGQPASDSRPGPAGPPDPGQSQPADGPMTPEAAQAAEEANLEYGRQATDLALKKLENELQRGEINEQWLKEMGWDKADAAQFLDRMKGRLGDQDPSTPEALAQQRQFNEWLKRLNKPATQTRRRPGSSVPTESARDLFNPQRSAPPAELRDLYEAYQRGISERSK